MLPTPPCTHTLPPNQPVLTYSLIYAHKNSVGCILDLPSPTSQPPPIQTPCPRRLSYKTPPTQGPLKAPNRASNLPFPRLPPPASQTQAFAPGGAGRTLLLNEWTRVTQRKKERKRQSRLLSTKWTQIDLFLPTNRNMPYILIKIYYIISTRGACQPFRSRFSLDSLFLQLEGLSVILRVCDVEQNTTLTQSPAQQVLCIPPDTAVVIITPGEVFPHQLLVFSHIKFRVAVSPLILEMTLSIRQRYVWTWMDIRLPHEA